jgi:hypothetical protein
LNGQAANTRANPIFPNGFNRLRASSEEDEARERYGFMMNNLDRLSLRNGRMRVREESEDLSSNTDDKKRKIKTKAPEKAEKTLKRANLKEKHKNTSKADRNSRSRKAKDGWAVRETSSESSTSASSRSTSGSRSRSNLESSSDGSSPGSSSESSSSNSSAGENSSESERDSSAEVRQRTRRRIRRGGNDQMAATMVKATSSSNGNVSIDILRNNKQDIKEWFETYERVTRSHGWGREKRGKRLLGYLKDAAV